MNNQIKFDKIVTLRTKYPKDAVQAFKLILDLNLYPDASNFPGIEPFVKEEHGGGAVHYSLDIDGVILIEIYPEEAHP